ncbi:MAG: cyclic 2,3-diphosphoglycerate synthase [bacterium]
MSNFNKKKVVILGAGGRDFHNFNVYYKDNENYEVVAFTATQIPGIENRVYPASLAGKLYPNGIPILPEDKLEDIIKEYKVDEVVFSYSDVSHVYVMNLASKALKNGANFLLLSPDKTFLYSNKFVIAVTAIRTGCGKSQTSRKVASILKKNGYKVSVIRHPMPYGDLEKQRVQRFASVEDIKKHNCTVEEGEEYLPHIKEGHVVFAGVDYKEILLNAEKESDVIVWDGGNNDFPFIKPDIWITVFDPHRPNHELNYFPGEVNARSCDVAVINKVDTAKNENVELVENNIKSINPKAIIIKANSPSKVSDPELIKGKRVIVVEDGPTLTHGEMSYGAGYVIAKRYNCKIVSPYDYAVNSIKDTYNKYKQVREVLPAMGYSKEQLKDLEETINRIPADVVILATPFDITSLININKPTVFVEYYLEEITKPDLEEIILNKLEKKGLSYLKNKK